MDVTYRENPIKMDDDWGYPHDLGNPPYDETNIWDNILALCSCAFLDKKITTTLWELPQMVATQ